MLGHRQYVASGFETPISAHSEGALQREAVATTHKVLNVLSYFD